MILTIVLVLILFGAFRYGYHYGLVRALFRLISRLIIIIVSMLLAHRFGTWINQTFLENLSASFAASSVPDSVTQKASQFLASGIAFSIISIGGYWVLHQIERSLRFLNKIPLIGTVNRLAGGLVYLVLAYLIIFLVLQVTQTWTIDWYRDQLISSRFAQWILNQTPYLSQSIYDWWLAR
jgi:uncharacterized membrane protein required for colicin V production